MECRLTRRYRLAILQGSNPYLQLSATNDTSIARIQLKAERARKHLRDLESEIKAFLGSNPYRVGIKRDPQTRRLIYYLTSVEEVPESISLIAADVLQNLGSALDHLAYALLLVATGGRPGNQAKRVFFPIQEDATEYAGESRRKLKGLEPSAIAAIDAIKPYKGGNDLLWRMNQLNRVSKHRSIVMAGSEFRSVDVASGMLRQIARTDSGWEAAVAAMDLHLFLKPNDSGFPLRQGFELFEDLPDAEADQKMQFRFQVAFREPGIIEGDPLLETLRNMADVVDNVIANLAIFLKPNSP